MSSDKTKPTTIHDQVLTLSLQAGKLRDAMLKKKARDLPANTVEDLTSFSETLCPNQRAD